MAGGGGEHKSCFKSAENWAASSLHRVWVERNKISVISRQNDLKFKYLDFEVVPNQLKIRQQVAYGYVVIVTRAFCAR